MEHDDSPRSDKSVLIVDDEQRMADSLCDLLSASDYHAEVAYSGREAIVKLQKGSYKVVVTDLRMHDVNGLDVIRYTYDNHPRTLIIVITGHATTESAIEAVHYQVFDYLRKPFDFELFRMAIEKAFQRLEVEQFREDTAAMITHDIKIPLTSIIGFASMIYDDESEAFHPRAAEFAETIQANGQKILELIENFLTSCRVDSNTLNLTAVPVSPAALLEDVVEMALLEAKRQGHDIERVDEHAPEVIRADESLLYRALGNLLHNAIKYGAPSEPIVAGCRQVEAEQSPIGRTSICFHVTNAVEDVLPERLDSLFERYQRAHARPGQEGSGIGLYVVQAVAQAHGGRAVAEYVEPAHVRFEMYIPLSAETAAGGDG